MVGRRRLFSSTLSTPHPPPSSDATAADPTTSTIADPAASTIADPATSTIADPAIAVAGAALAIGSAFAAPNIAIAGAALAIGSAFADMRHSKSSVANCHSRDN